MIRLAVALLVLGLATQADAMGAACKSAKLDYAGTAAIRGYFDDAGTAGCQPRVSFPRMCFAQYVWEGGDTASLGYRRTPANSTCFPNENMATYEGFRAQLHEACAALGITPPPIVYAWRAELVELQGMIWGVESGTFPYQCLITARDDWDELTSELAANVPPYGLVLGYGDTDGSGDYASSPADCPDGQGGFIKCEFADLIEAACEQASGSSCSTAYKGKIHYLPRLDSITPPNVTYYSIGLPLDLSNPACVAWKVDELEHLWSRGAFDLVHLNHKLQQYRWAPSWGTPPKVAVSRFKDTGGADWINASGMPGETPWSSVPGGAGGYFGDGPSFEGNSASGVYTYGDYTEGLAAVATALEVAGIPYQWSVSEFVADQDGSHNDAATGANEELTFLDTVEDKATSVPVLRTAGVSEATRAAIYARVGGRALPQGGENTYHRPADACLVNGVSNAGETDWVVPRVQREPDDDLVVGVLGAPTVNWTGRVWCDVPTWDLGEAAPVASPDLTIGSTADGTTVTTSVCADELASGTSVVVFEFTQGETVLTSAVLEATP